MFLPKGTGMKLKEGLPALLTVHSAIPQSPTDRAKEADLCSLAHVWGRQQCSFMGLGSPEKAGMERGQTDGEIQKCSKDQAYNQKQALPGNALESRMT